MKDYKPIAESNNFIVLDRYDRTLQAAGNYQSEGDLEREFVHDLQKQGYEYAQWLDTPQKLLANVRDQLQILNNIRFSESESASVLRIRGRSMLEVSRLTSHERAARASDSSYVSTRRSTSRPVRSRLPTASPAQARYRARAADVERSQAAQAIRLFI